MGDGDGGRYRNAFDLLQDVCTVDGHPGGSSSDSGAVGGGISSNSSSGTLSGKPCLRIDVEFGRSFWLLVVAVTLLYILLGTACCCTAMPGHTAEDSVAVGRPRGGTDYKCTSNRTSPALCVEV